MTCKRGVRSLRIAVPETMLLGLNLVAIGFHVRTIAYLLSPFSYGPWRFCT